MNDLICPPSDFDHQVNLRFHPANTRSMLRMRFVSPKNDDIHVRPSRLKTTRPHGTNAGSGLGLEDDGWPHLPELRPGLNEAAGFE